MMAWVELGIAVGSVLVGLIAIWVVAWPVGLCMTLFALAMFYSMPAEML